MHTAFGPIVTAAVTPFSPDGSVNHDAFRAVLRHLVENGSTAVVVCGTTGESPTVTDDEKLAIFRTAVDEIGGTVPVIAGTGTNDTHHSIELTHAACEVGVDGVLVVTPYYNKPPREGLLRHFKAVARASSVPVIVYNIPSRVVINLEPDLIAELAGIENVVAVKQANPDLAQSREIASLVPDLALYAGNDDLLLPLLSLDSCVGGICVASHLVGTEMAQVVEAWRAGDEGRARDIDGSLADVYETLAITSNPIPVKAALNFMGIDVGGVRMPLIEASGMENERIRAMLERHGLTAGVTA